MCITGNIQAIRLPKAFRVNAREVWISKNELTGEITLKPKDDDQRKRNLALLFKMIEEHPLPDDFLSDGTRRNDPPPNQLPYSVITRAETRFGLALLNGNDKRRDSIGLLLLTLPALPWTTEAADLYGAIAARLQQTRQPIGAMDTMIAAHALTEKLTLVTHNARHFQRIPGLKLEDWTN